VVAKFGLDVGHHLSTAPHCVTIGYNNDNKIGQAELFQTFQ